MVKRLLLLNGLSIIGVVCSHAAQWVYLSMFWWTDRYLPVTVPNYDQLGSPSYYAIVVFQKLGVFSVPAFLFTSGFFVAYAARGESAFTWKMAWVRLRNLLIPYLIWSVVIFAGDALQGIIYPPLGYLQRLLVGEAVPAYYYVILLCQMYLLSPLLAPLAKKHGRLLLVLTGSMLLGVIGLFYVKLFSVLSAIEMPLVDSIIKLIPSRVFVRFIFFFTLGIVAGFNVKQLKQWLERYRWLLLATVLVSAPLAIAETEWIFRTAGEDWRGGVFTITGAVYVISFVLAFMVFEKTPIPFSRALYELGKSSFGIYLLHTTLLIFFSRALQKYTPWLLAYQVVFLWVLVALAVSLPFLFMKAVARSPLKGFHRYLFG